MARRISSAFLLLFSLLLAGCDHATKLVASYRLSGAGPVEIVPGWLSLRYAENRDTAFSLTRSWQFEHKTLLLGLVSLAVLGALGALWWKRRHEPLFEQAGYAMILGGAIGNVADRLFRGYVVDFVHLRYWPVFNVADVAVVLGIAVLALRSRSISAPRAA
jgi:signal peptidase II